MKLHLSCWITVACLSLVLGNYSRATAAGPDDLRLEKIAAAKDWQPRIAIDATKTGPPISKYIYGQFIEHLGRCINEGLWAEMLLDRKFFYPVGSKESPWKSIGEGVSVAMETNAPFVGEQTPRIQLGTQWKPCGIAQAELGLLKGKSYVGRIWLAGDETPGDDEVLSVQISLVWGDGPNDRQTIAATKLTPEFRKIPLHFTAGRTTDQARLEITSRHRGGIRVGAASLMPADNVEGIRADVLGLLKEIDGTVYRWPGGNFVSGYNWRDGIGDVDRRPPRKNPAWENIEPNDFGIDEFLTLCRLLGTEPYIVVNSGQGEVQAAVEELQYINGPADSTMGKLRAENGHREPYGVKYWGIGNEMYGTWQLGQIPLEDYTKKHNRFAQAMRAEDPSIELIGVGFVGAWDEGMLRQCADAMELISEHFYCVELPGLIGHVRQVPDSVRRIADAHRRYRQQFDSLAGKDLRIALDEWNYCYAWHPPYAYGQLGHRCYLKDALGMAAGLHEIFRNSDLFAMANYSITVNVIGAVKTSKTHASISASGLPMLLYRRHFGTVPLAVQADEPLDVAAALSEDGQTLTLGIVNPTHQSLELPLELTGLKLSGPVTRYEISGPKPKSHNEPGQPPRVVLKESSLSDIPDKLPVAPCSVTLYRFRVKS